MHLRQKDTRLLKQFTALKYKDTHPLLPNKELFTFLPILLLSINPLSIT